MNDLREDDSNIGAPDFKWLRLDDDDNEPVAKHRKVKLNGEGTELQAEKSTLSLFR